MSDQSENQNQTTEKKENHKMKKHTKIILTTAAVIAVATPLVMGASYAKERWQGHHGYGYGYGHGMMRGDHGKKMIKMIQEIDVNKDGQVDQQELTDWQQNKLSKFDNNQSGTIGLEEFEAMWLEHKRSKMVDKFQHFDEDGDGQVTVEELSAPANFMFKRLDENGDNVISKEELERIYKCAGKHHKYGEKYRGDGGNDDLYDEDDDYDRDDDDDDNDQQKKSQS